MMISTQGSRLTAAGFAVMLFAVGAGVGSGEYGVLVGLMGVLVGANLVTLGVRSTADEEHRGVLVGTAAGVILASSAVTVVAGEASSGLCFSMFAVLLLGISLITIGIHGE